MKSLISKLRDEVLNGENFHTAAEARVLIGRWREHDDRVRPHGVLRYRPPAPGAITAGSHVSCVDSGLNSGNRWRLHHVHRWPQRALERKTSAGFVATCPAGNRSLPCLESHKGWTDESDPVNVLSSPVAWFPS